MGASLATVNALTKEIYGPRVVNQLEDETVLTKRIEKTSEGTSSEVGGKYVTFPLKVRRNTGIGYRNENETLMPAGQQGWNSVRVPLRYGYGRILLTGQTIELVNTNSQAFASAMTEEMNGLKDDIKKDTNRILWGNGLGVLGTVETGGATATIDLGSGFDDIKYLDMDMKVDVLSSNGTTVKLSGATVIGMNEDAGTVTLDGAVTTVAGDIVVRNGNYGREPHGLTSLVTDSTAPLFNLSSTDEPLWKSIVDNTGGALSESKMIAMCDRLRQKGNRPSVIFTDLATRRAYFNLLTTQRRFVGVQNFDGGFEGLAFSYEGDIPVIPDVDAPKGKMWFLREDSFKLYRSQAWHWEDRDGSIWNRVPDKDAFGAFMKQYWEFATQKRNANAVMTGITPG